MQTLQAENKRDRSLSGRSSSVTSTIKVVCKIYKIVLNILHFNEFQMIQRKAHDQLLELEQSAVPPGRPAAGERQEGIMVSPQQDSMEQ
jgi:hypothetical protein